LEVALDDDLRNLVVRALQGFVGRLLLTIREGKVSDERGRKSGRIGLRALLWGIVTQRETKEIYYDWSFNIDIELVVRFERRRDRQGTPKNLAPRGVKHERT